MDTITSPVRFSDIVVDGTYLVDASGTLHRMNYTSGYTVAVKPIGLSFDSASTDYVGRDVPKLTLVSRWTHPVSGNVYWDEVEVIDSLLEAGNVARQRGELAIWDNLNNSEFFV